MIFLNPLISLTRDSLCQSRFYIFIIHYLCIVQNDNVYSILSEKLGFMTFFLEAYKMSRLDLDVGISPGN